MNYYMMGLDNLVTMLLLILSSIIVLYAQIKIKYTYSKYKQIENKNNLTGFDVARKILDKHNLENVHIVEVTGELTDHYDPTRKVVRLSSDVFHNQTVASVAIASHEVGHAIQDKENYTFMRIRASLVPIVNFISGAGFLVIIISLIAGITGYLTYGILMIFATLLFQLVTLPVEIDASKRALNELKELNLVDSNELDGTKKVLISAAMTYVASLISTILNLLRLIIMLNDRDDR